MRLCNASKLARPLARRRRPDLILAIETSCDDTCLAILGQDNRLIRDYAASQRHLHQPFGGVVPQLAASGHRRALHSFLNDAHLTSLLRRRAIKCIAVTAGPGIGACLNSGYEFATLLSRSFGVPMRTVNHLHGHLQSVAIDHKIHYPHLFLVVSGGNTQLIYGREFGKYVIMGQTIDDPLGEAIDKLARMFSCNWGQAGGLGRALELLAVDGKPIELNVSPLADGDSPLDFSFSGLKTLLKDVLTKRSQEKSARDLAATVQKTLFDHVLDRLRNCVEVLKLASIPIQHLSVIGGVACNLKLRELVAQLCSQSGLILLTPEPKFCTDNAVMIGAVAREHLKSNDADVVRTRVDPNWNLEDLCIKQVALE